MSAEEQAQVMEEGERLLEAGDYAAALAAFDQAIALKLGWAEAWAGRGAALDELGRHQQAVESYDQAIALEHKDPAEAWCDRGIALVHLGKAEEALASFDKAIALKEDLPNAWVGRGFALWEMGEHQNAVISLDKAIKLKKWADDDAIWEFRLDFLRGLEKWLRERLPPKPHMEARELVGFCEGRLHLFIRQRLIRAFGHEEGKWWPQIPLSIREKCAKRQQEGLPRQGHIYIYTDLIDLKEIMDKHWRLFEPDLRRVKGKIDPKKELLNNLARLNEIRNMVSHQPRWLQLTDADLAFARQMREVIESFASLE